MVKAYELQFKITRRTLTDVLGAYTELADIEQEYVSARNDFRDAGIGLFGCPVASGQLGGRGSKE